MGGPDTSIEEPNLVPLLDLVLQLVMFFMAVTNFAMESLTQDVKLPFAQSAKPVEDVGTDILYVNISERGDLLVERDNIYLDGKIDGMVGKQVDADGNVSSPGQFSRARRNQAIEGYLKRLHADKKMLADSRAEDRGVVRTLVILRAHQDANFKDVYEVMRICRSSGFRKMQLRAIISGNG